MHHYKVAVLGEEGVGKTELSRKFCFENSLGREEYANVVTALMLSAVHAQGNKYKDTYQKHIVDIVVDGKISNIKIIDTFPPFSSLQRDIEYYRTLPKEWACEGYLLVYSIDSRYSFNRIRLFHDKIIEGSKSSDPVITVVGNKTDLERNRKVSPEEGSGLAQILGCGFVETSAATSNNVGSAFRDVFQKLNAEPRGMRVPGFSWPTVKKKDSECVHQ